MSEVNYAAAQAQQAEADTKAQRDEANAQAWHAILDRFYVRDTQANYSLAVSWSSGRLTLESFEALLRHGGLDMSSREGIIDDIIQNSFGDANALRSLRLRLSTYSLSQLRQKRRTIAFKQAINTKADAEKFVVSQRETEVGWRGTGYPRLASTHVPRGQVTAIPTGQWLRGLAKEDLYEFKRIVRLYGSEQCNHWLNQQ